MEEGLDIELFFILFRTLSNRCFGVVRGNAAQRHCDGRHQNKLGTGKGHMFVNLYNTLIYLTVVSLIK